MTVREAVPDRLSDLNEPADLDWDALYADQLPRIYNYFRFRLGSQTDVEDLTARTFENAWRARRRYRRDRAGFSTWLYTIARNIATDHLRARREVVELDAARDVAAPDTPATEAEHGSDLARLRQLTTDLPERERELIALKYGAALNNRLIAQLTGLSVSNVGTILHRTVQALRERW